MAKLLQSVFALAIGLAFLLLPATTVAAQSVWDAPDYATPDNPDRVIPGGWPTYDDAADCAARDACPELEGQAFATVDISNKMENYESYADFYVANSYHTHVTTYWFVVAYDSSGDFTDWWYDDEAGGGLGGELPGDARELRLFPVQSAANEFWLDVYVE